MMFAPGDAVVVKNDWPEARGPAHIRTPHYVRGRAGRSCAISATIRTPRISPSRRPAAKRRCTT